LLVNPAKRTPLIDLNCNLAAGRLMFAAAIRSVGRGVGPGPFIRSCTGAEINGKVTLEGLPVAEGYLLIAASKVGSGISAWRMPPLSGEDNPTTDGRPRCQSRPRNRAEDVACRMA
jgi:hypothetical protein